MNHYWLLLAGDENVLACVPPHGWRCWLQTKKLLPACHPMVGLLPADEKVLPACHPMVRLLAEDEKALACVPPHGWVAGCLRKGYCLRATPWLGCCMVPDEKVWPACRPLGLGCWLQAKKFSPACRPLGWVAAALCPAVTAPHPRL